MAFNNYLEDEKDKPYFTKNSLAYYYDKMEGFAKAVENAAKTLNLTKEEIDKRLTDIIAEWNQNLTQFPESVTVLLQRWVDDGTFNHMIDTSLINDQVDPISEQLTIKVGGGVKAEPEDLSERSLALMTGQGTINLLSIPQDGSVSPEKTTFVTKGKNKWNGIYTMDTSLGGSMPSLAFRSTPNAISVIHKAEKGKSYVLSKSNDTDRFGVAVTSGAPIPSTVTARSINGNTTPWDSIVVTLQGGEDHIIIHVSSDTQGKQPAWLQIEEGTEATGYSSPYAVRLLLETDDEEEEEEVATQPKINAVKTGDTLNVYVPSQTTPNRYMRYTYMREIDALKKLDNWRQKMVGVYTKSNDQYMLDFNLAINDTEYEGAIQELGAADFIGGFHGDEYTESFSLLIDGKEVDMTLDFNIECSFIKAVNKSRVNRCDTTEKAYTRYKASIWDLDSYQTDNKWIAEIPMQINQAKMTMCAIDKVSNGKNLLKWGRNDFDYEKTDVSADFKQGAVQISRKDVDLMELWSQEQNFYVGVRSEYDKTLYPNRRQYIEDFGGRAKIYFDLGSRSIIAGDVIKYKSMFDFRY